MFFPGYLFAYDADFTDNSTIASWSFFAGSANGGDVVGHQITPVIIDRTNTHRLGDHRPSVKHGQFWQPAS